MAWCAGEVTEWKGMRRYKGHHGHLHGLADAGGLDEEVVKCAAARQPRHLAQQVPPHRAADAPVRQLHQLLIRLRATPVSHDAHKQK